MFCICGLRRLRYSTYCVVLENLQNARYVQTKKGPPLLEEDSSTLSENEYNLSTSHLMTLSEVEDHGHNTTNRMPQAVLSHDSTEVEPETCGFFKMDNTNSNKIVADNVPVEEMREKVLHSQQGTRSSHSEKGSGKKIKSSQPHYPLMNMGDKEETFTSNFETSQKFLQSLNIETHELAYYPNVQAMSEEEILLCIERLKEIGIAHVFNLFLISRIAAEMQLEKTAKRAPLPHAKSWFKLRNGKYKLTSLQPVLLYLELCSLLERPRLDLYRFMDDLAALKIHEQLSTIVCKVQLLRSVGATPDDILSNLALLRGGGMFRTKIKVYKNLFRQSKPPFSVNLFLASTLSEFMGKLQAGNNIDFIASLLGVKPVDFMICWGFKPIGMRSLTYKIRLCIKAGMSQQDVFNNINLINRLSLKKTIEATKSISESSQAMSLYELKELEHKAGLTEVDASDGDKDWTSEEEENEPPLPQDSSVFVDPVTGEERLGASGKTKRKGNVDSSKIWRMEVFRLIGHLLQLSTRELKAMYGSNVNVDSTCIQDINLNLEHLNMNLKFTKEQIAACPLVLAHPHHRLVHVTTEVETLLDDHFDWVGVAPTFNNRGGTSSSPSPPLSTRFAFTPAEKGSSIFTAAQGRRKRRSLINRVSVKESRIFLNSTYARLLTDPALHLNILQYFLEKEGGFKLTFTDVLALGD